MKYAKFITILLSVICVLSCDDSTDYFSDINIKPELYLIKDATKYSVLQDTFKITNKQYSIQYYYHDNDPFSSAEKNINILHGSGTLKIDENDSLIQYVPESIGEHELDLTVTDGANTSATVNLKLHVYDNDLPVAKMTLNLLEDNRYRIDASDSYDLDGSIIEYYFDYGSKQFTYTEPIIFVWADHIIDNGGITLTVTDNKGAKSLPLFVSIE